MIRIIDKREYKVSNWSGGTTTEIFLSPENGSYAGRRFDFRISSATVDLEESDFTPLAGVKRYLTTLEGDLKLTFSPAEDTAVHRVTLKPYEVVEFMGDVPTHSMGKARDFNLMLKGFRGEMETYSGEGFIIETKAEEQVFIFSLEEWVANIKTSSAEDISYDVAGFDTLHIFNEDTTIEVKGSSSLKWVVIRVNA